MKQTQKLISVIAFLFLVTNSAFSAIQVDTFSSASSVSNLATADGLIDGSIVNNGTATAFPDFVDHYDGSGGTAHFSNNLSFPGNFTSNFAYHATCQLEIPVTGAYLWNK